jgi:ATP-dependent RNA helicase DeaD
VSLEASAPAAVEVSLEAGGPRPAAAEGASAEVVVAGGEERRPQRGRVFVTLGQNDGADEARVRAALAALAPGVEALAVEVRQSHSFLEVEPAAVEALVAALDGKEFEGKALTAERARRRRR